MLRPRHFVAYGYPSNPMSDYFKSIYDSLETLSYIAAKAERIKLGTSVINALFHVPVVLARRFATLDQFSRDESLPDLGKAGSKTNLRQLISPSNSEGKVLRITLEHHVRLGDLIQFNMRATTIVLWSRTLVPNHSNLKVRLFSSE